MTLGNMRENGVRSQFVLPSPSGAERRLMGRRHSCASIRPAHGVHRVRRRRGRCAAVAVMIHGVPRLTFDCRRHRAMRPRGTSAAPAVDAVDGSSTGATSAIDVVLLGHS
jgi:hypothetical protein